MKIRKTILVSCAIAMLTLTVSACGAERETTTIRRETVESVSDNPVVIEKKTTIHSETVE